MKKTIKYKTHPIYKALMWLMLIVSVSAFVFAWAVFASAEAKEEKCEKMILKCKYEAYLSFCEKLSELAKADEKSAVMSKSAAEALGRYVMFSSGVQADPDALIDRLLSAEIYGEEAEKLIDLIKAVEDADDAMLSVIEAAERAESEYVRSPGRKSDGWKWLSSQPEVKATYAEKLAERFIGGGGNVRATVSHSFPLVYSYANGNACAEITRMGGKLIRFYKFPIGNAVIRDRDECIASAERFLRDAGISGGKLMLCEVDSEGVFCTFYVCGDAAANVTVNVAFGGATVVYFDAYEYYRWRQ